MPKSAFANVIRYLHRVCALQGDSDLSDRELLGRFVEHRDEDAFTFLVRRHGPMIFGVCRRLLGDSQEAEDAFQATFLVLVRRSKSIRRREALGSWLHSVAQRIALRARRSQPHVGAREGGRQDGNATPHRRFHLARSAPRPGRGDRRAIREISRTHHPVLFGGQDARPGRPCAWLPRDIANQKTQQRARPSACAPGAARHHTRRRCAGNGAHRSGCGAVAGHVDGQDRASGAGRDNRQASRGGLFDGASGCVSGGSGAGNGWDQQAGGFGVGGWRRCWGCWLGGLQNERGNGAVGFAGG